MNNQQRFFNMIIGRISRMEKKIGDLSTDASDNLFKIPLNSSINIDNQDELKKEVMSELKLELNITEDKFKEEFIKADKMLNLLNQKCENNGSMVKTIISRMTNKENELNSRIDKLDEVSEDTIMKNIKNNIMEDLQDSLIQVKNNINLIIEENKINLEIVQNKLKLDIKNISGEISKMDASHRKLNNICMNQITPTLQKLNIYYEKYKYCDSREISEPELEPEPEHEPEPESKPKPEPEPEPESKHEPK